MILSDEVTRELSDGRLSEFIIYHMLSDQMGDIDPQYPMLRYVCDRFELNMEQRYWLAFLTGASYCAPTVYYMYNEFPDYENVDSGRLQRWWYSVGREKTVFQSDRAWIRSRNQIIPMFESYRSILSGKTQEQAFSVLRADAPEETYEKVYKHFSKVKYFGRFGMFLWMEAVHVVTGFPMHPLTMNWKESSSTSSRNGLCFALGYDDLVRKHGFGNEPISEEDYDYISDGYFDIAAIIKALCPAARVDIWNLETTLCAYKKWVLGELDHTRKTKAHYRYPGYYLDRQHDEIIKLQNNVTDGVCWDVLWDFRKETFDTEHLKEYGADNRTWSAIELQKRFDLFDEGELIV